MNTKNRRNARSGDLYSVQPEVIKVGNVIEEAGSYTSTVTLRVVGGDEMGSLKSETVKYGR
jgi:hypothetical protein